MKKYRINDRTVTVRKGSLAHRVLDSKYIMPLLGLIGATGMVALIYANVIIWSCVLGQGEQSMKKYTITGYSPRFGVKNIGITDNIIDALRIMRDIPALFKSVGIFVENGECIFMYTHGHCLCKGQRNELSYLRSNIMKGKYMKSIINTKPKEMGNVKKTIYLPKERKHPE